MTRFAVLTLDSGETIELILERGKPRRIEREISRIAAELGLSEDTAAYVSRKLTSFYGTGPHADYFDAEAYTEREDPTPQITLFDLEGVSNDPIMSTLTMMVCWTTRSSWPRPTPKAKKRPVW